MEGGDEAFAKAAARELAGSDLSAYAALFYVFYTGFEVLEFAAATTVELPDQQIDLVGARCHLWKCPAETSARYLSTPYFTGVYGRKGVTGGRPRGGLPGCVGAGRPWAEAQGCIPARRRRFTRRHSRFPLHHFQTPGLSLWKSKAPFDVKTDFLSGQARRLRLKSNLLSDQEVRGHLESDQLSAQAGRVADPSDSMSEQPLQFSRRLLEMGGLPHPVLCPFRALGLCEARRSPG